MKNSFTSLIGAVILTCSAFNAQALDAPAGVRPCCAFGTGLKAQLGRVPVPFFSLENVLEPGKLGKHIYNDGSQGVTSSLLGISKENNGLLYTHKGGFIDIAHVRDTADYTYYLYNEIWPYIGTDHSFFLPTELRRREIVLKANNQVLDNNAKRHEGIKLAGLLAFRLAQWHEIAQWFGMTSVGGWSELASAFSPEDLYSNMLGSKLAMTLLNENPKMSKKAFCEAFKRMLDQHLQNLGVVSKAETEQRIKAVDGDWWNSSKRLPNKWVLRKRDYHLSLVLTPHGADKPLVETIETSDLGELRLLPDDNGAHEIAFAQLPQNLKNMPYWQPENFVALANFAKDTDLKVYGDADINQTVSND